MGYITKHLYVTKAQKAWAVPRPGDILPSFLPHAEADCLCAWGGPAGLNLIANILFFFQIPYAKKQLSFERDIYLQRSKSPAAPVYSVMPKAREALFRAFFQMPGLRLQTVPLLILENVINLMVRG